MEKSLRLKRGAEIIVENWMAVKRRESVMIITQEAHLEEMRVVKAQVEGIGAKADIRLIPRENFHMSDYTNALTAELCNYQVIIGATHYSLVTTEMVKKAVKEGSRFLSLPLAANDGRSLLEYDFLTMDTYRAGLSPKICSNI